MSLERAKIKGILTRAMVDDEHIEAAISEIAQGNSDSISALTGEIASLKDDISKLKSEKGKLESRAKELEKIQGDYETLKAQVEADTKEREGKDYDKLKEEFENYKTEQANKAIHASKETAYRDILKDAGIPEKHFAKILKYSDIDSIELDEKGKIKDSKDLLKSIKDEWSDHIETPGTIGANTATPPANTGGSGKTKEEIMAIKDTAERQQAMIENAELFGLG